MVVKKMECIKYYITRFFSFGQYDSNQFQPIENQINDRVIEIQRGGRQAAEEPAVVEELLAVQKPALTPAQVIKANEKKKSDLAKALNEKKAAQANAINNFKQ